MRIVVGVPLVVIDAIKDSNQRGLSLAQDIIQSAAKFLGGNFTGVSGADSRNEIRVDDPGLHATHVAVKLQAFGIEIIERQIGEIVSGPRKVSLVSEIVNAEHAARSTQPAIG